MKKRIWKATVWIGSSAGSWALLWFGLHGLGWCWNLFRFIAWLFTFLFLMGYLLARDGNKQTLTETRGVPAWLTMISDFGMAGVLAAFGHFGYATLMVAQQLLEASYFQQIKEHAAKAGSQ